MSMSHCYYCDAPARIPPRPSIPLPVLRRRRDWVAMTHDVVLHGRRYRLTLLAAGGYTLAAYWSGPGRWMWVVDVTDA